MLAIVEGSIEKVRSEMGLIAKQKADEIKSVKARIGSWNKQEKNAAKKENRKVNAYPKELTEKLEELQRLKDRYSSAVVPVRVKDIVINYTVYLKAFSKLKGLVVFPEEVSESELIIRYRDGKPWEINVTGAKGHIHLYDISRLYSDLNNIPVAEIQRDVQTA